MSRLLAPMLAMVCLTAVEDPWPISIMAITAATPMMIPRVVRAERRTFRRRPTTAMRKMRYSFLIRLALPPALGRVLDDELSGRDSDAVFTFRGNPHGPCLSLFLAA